MAWERESAAIALLLALVCATPAHAGFYNADANGYHFFGNDSAERLTLTHLSNGWYAEGGHTAGSCPFIVNSACNAPGAVPVVNARMGAGNDTFTYQFGSITDDLFVFGERGNDTLNGGAGIDSLDGGLHNDVLNGKAGNDVLAGGSENDTFVPELGADRYSGGSGIDSISYRTHTPVGVHVVLNSIADDTISHTRDGVTFTETDNVLADIENVTGSAGADTIRGANNKNSLDGLAGDDVLSGSVGDDRLTGGPGLDHLRGESGNDTLIARDAEPDIALICGPDVDLLVSDLRDGPPPADCESVDQGAVKEGPNVRISRRALRVRRASARVRLRCPRRLRIRCAGTLRAGQGRKSRYSIRPGKSQVVQVRVRGNARRTRLTSVEKGEHGPKTTVRTVRLVRTR